MKRNIVLIVLVACNIWLCIILILNKQDYNSKLSLLQAKSIDECKNQVSDAFTNTIKYAETSFILSDSATVIIKELFSTGNASKLFYRLSFPYCESCIYPVIDKIIKKYPELRKDDIVLISAFPTEEYAEEFNHDMENKKLRVINIPDIQFYLDRNNFDGSYLFIMDSNLHHKNLFFTNKCNLFLTDNYIDFIKQSNKH